MAKNDKLPSAFAVMLAIRDAKSTRGAQRELLYALALRCNKERKYSCYPSYELLSEDTGLNRTTLKRAAAELEAASIIKRLVRRNRSNTFLINVALLSEQAEVRRQERKQHKETLQLGGFAGFDDPQPLESDDTTEDANENSDVFADREDL